MPVSLNVNVDRVRHQGVELSGNFRPWDWLEIFGTYTYDNVRIQRIAESSMLKGTRMPITPEHRGNVGFTVFLPYGFEVGGNANYVGSRPVANDLFEVADKLPRYATYDARVAGGTACRYGFSVTIEGIAYNVTGPRVLRVRRHLRFPAVRRRFLPVARPELPREPLAGVPACEGAAPSLLVVALATAAAAEPPNPYREGTTPIGVDGAAAPPSVQERIEWIRARLAEVLVYPKTAQKRGIEGTSRIQFVIGPDGRAREIRTVESSGHVAARPRRRAVRDRRGRAAARPRAARRAGPLLARGRAAPQRAAVGATRA